MLPFTLHQSKWVINIYCVVTHIIFLTSYYDNELTYQLYSLITSRVEVNILRSINPHFSKVKVHSSHFMCEHTAHSQLPIVC